MICLNMCLVCMVQQAQVSDAERGIYGLRFMFYNVENLFDPFNDSLKLDDDFTASGVKHWTWHKMQKKCGNIARVMIAAGGWEAVEMVGLCEVENALVLRQIIKHPLLKPYRYQYIVTSSPDKRGINIAFLYRPEKIGVVDVRSIRVSNPLDTAWATRDILYVKTVTLMSDTLHIFLNHWPSRMGGAEASAFKRGLAAKALRQITDSLLAPPGDANILIAGDFNDEPTDSSLISTLGAGWPGISGDSLRLVNMMLPLAASGLGTHAHRDVTGTHFNLLDQIILSARILDPEHSLVASEPVIGAFSFLLEENAAGIAIPDRTYVGPRYIGGYSDHLPVIIDFRMR